MSRRTPIRVALCAFAATSLWVAPAMAGSQTELKGSITEYAGYIETLSTSPEGKRWPAEVGKMRAWLNEAQYRLEQGDTKGARQSLARLQAQGALISALSEAEGAEKANDEAARSAQSSMDRLIETWRSVRGLKAQEKSLSSKI